MPVTWIIFILLSFLLLEVAYFQLARYLNIVDKPNHRSSHSVVTVRGGGIIFFLSVIADSILFNNQDYYFILGLCLLALVSFIDDITPLNSKLRFTVHFVAALLLLMQLNLLNWSVISVVSVVLIIAVINAVNFMDGINGITGLYGLLTLVTLLLTNQKIGFAKSTSLVLPILAVLVFLFFNFRKAALCFAGDVGSVSIAFIILYFLFELILKTREVGYLYFIMVYGLDTGTTIFFRVLRREKITEAHRSHYYQFLANEKKIPHLLVAAVYVFVQACINFVFIKYLHKSVICTVAFLVVFSSLFIAMRFITEGRKKLLLKT